MKEDHDTLGQGMAQSGDIAAIEQAAPAYRQDELNAFEAYWNSMRHDGNVPLRTEIDPRRIESLLSNAFIAEKVAPGLARMRIAGSHLCDIMGMEVRGMPVSSLIASEHRDTLADALVDLFERPAILRLTLTSPSEHGLPKLTGTLLILPLRSDLGDISRALGCLVTQGDAGASPRRFKINRCDVSPVISEDDAPFAQDVSHDKVFVPPLRSERPYLQLVRDE